MLMEFLVEHHGCLVTLSVNEDELAILYCGGLESVAETKRKQKIRADCDCGCDCDCDCCCGCDSDCGSGCDRGCDCDCVAVIVTMAVL